MPIAEKREKNNHRRLPNPMIVHNPVRPSDTTPTIQQANSYWPLPKPITIHPTVTILPLDIATDKACTSRHSWGRVALGRPSGIKAGGFPYNKKK